MISRAKFLKSELEKIYNMLNVSLNVPTVPSG